MGVTDSAAESGSVSQPLPANATLPAPRRGDWNSFLGHRVRIYDGQHAGVMAEGEVIGYCDVPTILVRAADGTITHHASSLPIEVMEWMPV